MEKEVKQFLINNKVEYTTYNSYVENSVAQAKEFVAERVALFGR